jgi:hypothetical protein
VGHSVPAHPSEFFVLSSALGSLMLMCLMRSFTAATWSCLTARWSASFPNLPNPRKKEREQSA